MMTPDECRLRASQCARNASLAENEAIALEFMTLAARWRAMACRGLSLSGLGEPPPVAPGPADAVLPPVEIHQQAGPAVC